MAEIKLNPTEYQSQVDAFTKATDTLRAFKYKAEKNGVILQSVDKYMECVDAMNLLLTEYAELSQKDIETMKKIKATWMNADSDIATKTLGEIVLGK